MQNSEQVLTYRMLAAAVAAIAAFGLGSVAQATPGRETIEAPASIRIEDQLHSDLTASLSAEQSPFKLVAGLLVYDRLESDFSRGDEPVPDDGSLEDDSVKTNDSLDDDTQDDSLDDDSVKTDDSPKEDSVKTDDSLDDDSLKKE